MPAGEGQKAAHLSLHTFDYSTSPQTLFPPPTATSVGAGKAQRGRPHSARFFQFTERENAVFTIVALNEYK